MALLTKIRTRLAIHARRPVSGLLEGRYTSVLAGRSLDYADLREYIPGDDVSDIDWKASARSGGLLVKRYVADRKHTVVVVVDTGRELSAMSTWFDGAGASQRDLAIMVAGIVGWIAISHGDYVGLVCAGPDGPTIRRPTTREVELERMLELVESSSQPDSPGQDTIGLLDRVISMIRRRTILFLVLGDVELGPELEGRLRRLLVQHEVVVVTIADLDPTDPARSGRAVRDAGSGRGLPRFAATSTALAAEIAEATAVRADRRASALARLGVAHLHLVDSERVVGDLLDLLDRMRRAR